MTETTIVLHDGFALDGLVERARALVITNNDEQARVVDFVRGIKELRAHIDATFDPNIKRAYDTHRGLCDEKRKVEAQAVEAERIAKQLLVDYDSQLRRAIEIERARRDREQHDANSRLEAAATLAEAQGDLDEADALRRQQSTAPTPTTLETPRSEGISFRETWSARVVDFDALVTAAAAHKPYLALLQADMRALNAQAKSLKSRLSIPGVVAISSRDVAARK